MSGPTSDAGRIAGPSENLEQYNPEAAERIKEVRDAHAQTLDLSGCGLQAIPSEVFEMAWLESLIIDGNNLRQIPDDIARLTSLRELRAWDNRSGFLQLSDRIGELSKLTALVIGGGLRHLPDGIRRCSELRELAIGGNDLGALPLWLSELHNLEELQLWENDLSSLPDWWENFPKLRVLNLADNQLLVIPPSIGKLVSLRHLDLFGNALTDLPWALEKLQSLRLARLGGNSFTTLPGVVTKWSNLECLDLNGDPNIQLMAETPGPPLVYRAHRDIAHQDSRLEALHPDIRHLTKLRALLLYGNPLLQLPDELLGTVPDFEEYPGIEWRGSVENILDYYFRTRGGARPLNEAKLILLGWGGVGKTSLVKRLVHGSFDPSEERTEGIEVTSWPVTLADDEHVRLNVWDFGGQEIMHATHQFFLTSRSLYIVVLTGRAGSADTDADYWLKIVSSFAPESPVVVVLNQIARDPFELDETGLRQRFPNIRAFVRTDCAEDIGIEHLVQVLLNTTSNLRDLRVSFPASWFEIKDRLAGMSENYLTFEKYRQVCADLGEMDSQAQELLADYLHSLGIALNYREDPRLRDTHVLNPHWVTEGIYAILNSRLVAEQHGEVTASDLARILDTERYPAERHVFLLDLMRRFELCFPYADEPDKYLVADLLPKQQPGQATNFAVQGSLQFEYRYPLLPEGLLPRFIVRSHVHSADQPRWRSGALLRWEQNSALVQADSANRIVRIFVTGPVESRRRLLAVIRSDFEHIHSSYRFKVSAFVPSPDLSGLAIEYDKLLAAENEGRDSFPEYYNGTFVDIGVKRYLTGVDLAVAPSRARTPRPARLFVSYSHKDDRYRDAFDSHLKVFNSARLLDVWHDRRIGPGDDWKGEIDRALEEADIVVFLVSADLLASEYCNDVEMKRALERQAAGECRIVPIIVRDAKWQLSKLADFQAMPRNGKPITTWPNQDTAWRNVADGLEQIIKRL